MISSINPERLEVIEKIQKFEMSGYFDTDIENDPPTKPLEAKDIDYLRKKPINKLKSFFVNKKADKEIERMIKNKQIIIKDVVGTENLENLQGSAFVTSNHFHPFENMAIYHVFKKYSPVKRKFWRVIREGNFTNPPKGFDLFFKHCNTLPLSRSHTTMKKFLEALETISRKNSFILIYPEQYMWWNYKKPRPFKDGVFRFASKLNKPIIPCFITLSDSSILDSDGLPVQEYTVHISKPLYPDPNKTLQENISYLKNANFNIWKDIYETTYGIKLEYLSEAK